MAYGNWIEVRPTRRASRCRPPARRRSRGCAPRPARTWTACRAVPARPRCTSLIRRELGAALPGLLEQPRVLERDAEAPGDRLEEPDVGVAERVLTVDVLQRHQAGDPIAHQRAGRTRPTSASRRRARPAGPPRCAVRRGGRSRRRSRASRPRSRRWPISSIGSSSRRTPRSMTYGKWTRFVEGSRIAMSTTCASKISWMRSPTRSYIDCMSSRSARPACTSLIRASSALRCRVSSNSRAFSRATRGSRRAWSAGGRPHR